MDTSTVGSAIAERCSYAPPAECRPHSPEKSSTAAAALSYRRTERTALYIETQEGDVVRVRIKVRDAVNATASGGTEGADTELAVTARSSTKIRFSVEGDLNAEELAAIRRVIDQASALADEFFAGDLPEAFAAAQALEIDADTLARVGLRLSVREHLTYLATGAFRSLPAAPQPSAPDEAATPPLAAAESPALSAPATEPPAALPAETASDAPTDAPVDAPPADPAPAPALPQSAASQALTTIADFIADLLDSLAPPTDGDSENAAASLDLSVRLRIVRAMVVDLSARAEPQPAAASGVALAADTLEALAAQKRSLDAHA